MSQFESSQSEPSIDNHLKCAACCDRTATPSSVERHSEGAGTYQALRESPFFWPLLVIGVYSLVELAGGVWTHSLALLGDAWHMLADVAALALALWASLNHANPQVSARRQRTVATMNALAMLAVTVWMIFEAWSRVQLPRPVAAAPMTVIAIIGLLVNLWVAQYMHSEHKHDGHVHDALGHDADKHAAHGHAGDLHAHEPSHHHAHAHSHSLNHRAAFLHVLGDLLGSVVAVLAGLVIHVTGDTRIDPLLSFVISAVLLTMTLHLMRDLWRSRKPSHTPHEPHAHHESDHSHAHHQHQQPHQHKH